MSGTARLVSRLAAGISVLFVTLFGSAAYASQPGPDVISDGVPSLSAVTPPSVLAQSAVSTTSNSSGSSATSASSGTDYVSWTLSAVVAVLVVAAFAIAITALYRRHQNGARQLQMP